MTRTDELDALVTQFDLNAHPFYVDWRNGVLPTDAMREYAAEHAPFISALADGWERIGEPTYAEEEREHDALWARFREALAADGTMRRSHSEALVATARHAFGSVPEAIGALYAIEAQQPTTAASKLAGLDQHYTQVPAGAREYFEVHARETDEVSMLAARLEALTDDEFARARSACALMCTAMWGGLDGVYYA